MVIKDLSNGKQVTFSSSPGSRSNLLNLSYSLMFFSPAIIGLYFFLTLRSGPDLIPGVVVLLVITASLFVSYRFGNKAFKVEKLLITKNELLLVTRGLSKGKRQAFQVGKISNFRHLDKPELSTHPLAGESIDYFGFSVGQKVVSELHGDKRLAFDYEGEAITFGENVYSWDFETLEDLVADITGVDIARKLKLEDELL